MQQILLYLFLSCCSLAFAQQKSIDAVFIASDNTEGAVFVGKDPFGFSYTIKDNEFRKSNATQKFQYRNLTFGRIKQVDLQSPLQIVLYYKSFNAAVLLDNQLNETTKINFSESNPELFPTAVSLASQNRLWLFDQNSQKLGLYDIYKNTFSAVSSPIKDTPVQYQSDYNYFYWIDGNQNCYVSNIFGKISFLGKAPEADAIQFISTSQVLLKKGNLLSLYNLENQTAQIVPILEKSIESFYYKEQILSIFTDNEIKNYKIILP
ncbi:MULTISPECIES: hypothetical protein [Flavobacterium]|uniref:hypothetical protein n=1 Tax=Flavobacterium TaxID=237 RepID=UPI00086ABB36|nr:MULTISPECIES: hypothetical protein [Flavobacterium]MBN9284341.1 hypothetical protein [Flavobacterium sp.]ODS85729.1 MAG: hypothetical protein ABS44_14675 [Chryseobacterium sp. SCN 40-13]OJV72962.1 MAG: hypothetical protein BGO42_00540 [Flavobacterium sp. 40-81]